MTLYKDIFELINIAFVSVVVFTFIIAYTRLTGLRSFAKMTSIDFATTIAIGSMIAAVILPSKVSITGGLFGIFIVYILQLGSSFLRARSKLFVKLTANTPQILVTDGVIDYIKLKEVNMALGELLGKLREANVLSMSQVKSVIFESTGDVSVLHGDHDVDDFLLSDARPSRLGK